MNNSIDALSRVNVTISYGNMSSVNLNSSVVVGAATNLSRWVSPVVEFWEYVFHYYWLIAI